jgi:hypothetical protein
MRKTVLPFVFAGLAACSVQAKVDLPTAEQSCRESLGEDAQYWTLLFEEPLHAPDVLRAASAGPEGQIRLMYGLLILTTM